MRDRVNYPRDPLSATEIGRPGDLTADWLTVAVGAGTVVDFSAERIGTGQMSECYRVSLEYATAPTAPRRSCSRSPPPIRAAGRPALALGLYEREVRFYTDIAPGIAGPVAPCYHAGVRPRDAASFTCCSATRRPAVVGDEIRGATVEQARLAMTELGRLHGPAARRHRAGRLPTWLNRESPMNQALITRCMPGFVERYGDEIAPTHREVCERLVAGFDAYLAQEAAVGSRSRAWCTATTGWTTCCSASRAPTGR